MGELHGSPNHNFYVKWGKPDNDVIDGFTHGVFDDTGVYKPSTPFTTLEVDDLIVATQWKDEDNVSDPYAVKFTEEGTEKITNYAQVKFKSITEQDFILCIVQSSINNMSFEYSFDNINWIEDFTGSQGGKYIEYNLSDYTNNFYIRYHDIDNELIIRKYDLGKSSCFVYTIPEYLIITTKIDKARINVIDKNNTVLVDRESSTTNYGAGYIFSDKNAIYPLHVKIDIPNNNYPILVTEYEVLERPK